MKLKVGSPQVKIHISSSEPAGLTSLQARILKEEIKPAAEGTEVDVARCKIGSPLGKILLVKAGI